MKTSRIRILRGRGTPPPCVSAAAPLFRFCLLLEQLVGPVKQPIQVWNPFEALDSDLAHQTCRSMLPSAQLDARPVKQPQTHLIFSFVGLALI